MFFVWFSVSVNVQNKNLKKTTKNPNKNNKIQIFSQKKSKHLL